MKAPVDQVRMLLMIVQPLFPRHRRSTVVVCVAGFASPFMTELHLCTCVADTQAEGTHRSEAAIAESQRHGLFGRGGIARCNSCLNL